MVEPVRLRVRSHGSYQVEIKIDYELSSARETRYTVNTYMFVPHTLGINAHTYSNDDFYRDVQNYVRLRTPIFRLDELSTDPQSPIANVEEILNDPNWYRSEQVQDQLVTNLKLVRPVLNASLRAHLRQALGQRRQLAHSPDGEKCLQTALDEVVTLGGAYVDRYRLLEERFCEQPDIDHVQEAYRLVDEAVSLIYEDSLMWSYRIAEKYFRDGTETRQRLREAIAQEIDYRRTRNYESIPQMDSTNERYLQVVSFLKKYTTSALYLSVSTEREGTALKQISFALAAGLAMVFATVVAFYSQARYGVFTFPVFVALVVGYMFKDRIKEIGRDLAEKFVRTIRYDQRTTLSTTDSSEKIGLLREKMKFAEHAKIPDIVLRKREEHYPDSSVLGDQDEEIISYTKEVTVRRVRLSHLDIERTKIKGVRDIMRYDIRRYLRKTADPFEQHLTLIDGQVVPVDCHKTYRLDFVTEYRSWNEQEPTKYQQTSVYIDRDGIVEIF
jgi:hypothetical protein